MEPLLVRLSTREPIPSGNILFRRSGRCTIAIDQDGVILRRRPLAVPAARR
jgi:hypothetical protein